MSTNDNDLPVAEAAVTPSDAHGQAALLLVESLIHGLCESATLQTAEAVQIVERAASVQLDRVHVADDAAEISQRSHALLVSIAASLRIDEPGLPPSPLLVP